MIAVNAAFSEFNIKLQEKAQFVNDTLAQLLDKQNQIDPDLKKAIKYTLQGDGKRIRAALVLWCCELVGGRINHAASIAAAAIEMVHTYSLVHDDLPAIDNDDLRRGRPTCHKAFDEATAILVGDSLLTLAFEILAKEVSDSSVAINLIKQLAQATGPSGMITGQMADLKSENKKSKNSKLTNKELLKYIHTNKTAKMFQCAAACGAICGGANKEELECLCKYGLKIGLGFQVADDILDVSSSSKQLGKTVGKDAKTGKITYPAILGLEKSREIGRKIAHEAVATLEPFGPKADTLQKLAIALLERTR